MDKLVDEVKIYIKAGDGGNGCASFRREKYVPRGGPSGGDGGKGGNVYILSSIVITSLAHLTRRQHYYAERGAHGGKKRLHGKNGKDLIIQVPIGTMLMDEESGAVVHDFKKEEQYLIAEGGKGGKGNARFATSTNQAPRRAEKGKEGEERWIRLVMKLVADIGIIGLPNSGKSTLISAITSAKSKIADYPFTTKSPVLGMLELEDYRCYIVVDMPAIIKGSYNGAGLGGQFLKHLERCKILLHIIDASSEEANRLMVKLNEINNELNRANPELGQIPQIIVLNKIDLIDDSEKLKNIVRLLESKGLSCSSVSALKHSGLDDLLDKIDKKINEYSTKVSRYKGE
jgi:GTP-binding protein